MRTRQLFIFWLTNKKQWLINILILIMYNEYLQNLKLYTSLRKLMLVVVSLLFLYKSHNLLKNLITF